MKIFIASDFRITIYKDKIYLPSKLYHILHRYYENFGEIYLCSRFIRVSELQQGYEQAPFIYKFLPIKRLIDIYKKGTQNKIANAIRDTDLVITREPSIIGYMVAKMCSKLNIPTLAEAMADPWDAYWNHGFIGKVVAPYMYLRMKTVMKDADFATYVTSHHLQNRYPTDCKHLSASDVLIKSLDKSILKNRLNKIESFDPTHFSIGTAGGIEVVAKGHKFVIEAMSALKKSGIRVEYYIMGGGNPQRLTDIASKNGVLDQVHFTGNLSMDNLFHQLDEIDIYIQPSLQEGLPRAVVEALGRACPALGSTTGGTPELLDSDCVFKRKSTSAIIKKLQWVIQQDLKKIATRNFEFCHNFLDDVISKQRVDYYDYVKSSIESNKEK